MSIPDMKRLPALIARARRECGADQREVARAIEVSLRTFSRWENGKSYPGDEQARDLAHALSNATGETWRALVDALRTPLDELLEDCPNQRAAADALLDAAKPSKGPGQASHASDAIVPVGSAAPQVATVHATVDLQGTVDDLIRAYAEEVDMSPRRLRLALGMLLGELRLLGVGLDDGQALVMRMPRRLR